MKAVRFNRAMRPYGAGDIALLPDDVAERMIDEGAAERVQLPDAPHASEGVTAAEPSRPAARKQAYKTKG